MPEANAELDSYIAGGSIADNQWRLVEMRYADSPLSFTGIFDRIDLQSDHPNTQPTLYIDDLGPTLEPIAAAQWHTGQRDEVGMTKPVHNQRSLGT